MQKSIFGGIALSAVLVNGAQAQEIPVELPPLILGSALRDDRKILDTPVAASVVEGEALEERQADISKS
ncbi:MAG: hypothetical protein ABNH38_17650 [Tateyamaria sp.]|jgi:hemoglobin/transferrin/lactoferrin receptor protein|uniref:hypothetical protein n=1 Tax=Tateyamaria sp. TaxID=1929288 RepID=UPI0032DDF2B1